MFSASLNKTVPSFLDNFQEGRLVTVEHYFFQSFKKKLYFDHTLVIILILVILFAMRRMQRDAASTG